MKPSALERGIGENVAAKLREDHAEQSRCIEEVVYRKQLHSGLARNLRFAGHPNY